MTRSSSAALLLFATLCLGTTQAFVLPRSPVPAVPRPTTRLASTTTENNADMATKRAEVKAALLRSLGAQPASAAAPVEPVLACPMTLKPLRQKTRLAGPFGQLSWMVAPDGTLRYPVNNVYMDLVPQEERNIVPFFSASAVVTQELFRSPFTSFLYERGWRQNFNTAGFPGIDQEFQDFEGFLAPLLNTTSSAPTTIVDLSCGSGLMARRLVSSGKWGRVIAADFSESMLRETRRRFLEQKLTPPELVRADASRLPFQTASLDAIHAGAALHCWPRLEESLRECLRVLKPGGRMYASTFEVNERLQSTTFRFFQLEELKRLFVQSGFDQVEVRREGAACLIVKAVKGEQEDELGQ